LKRTPADRADLGGALWMIGHRDWGMERLLKPSLLEGLDRSSGSVERVSGTSTVSSPGGCCSPSGWSGWASRRWSRQHRDLPGRRGALLIRLSFLADLSVALLCLRHRTPRRPAPVRQRYKQ
jgi:hypothetical protein